MDISHAIILALLQGITEFLPISSSAHLILVPELLGWVESGLAFDVALHVGTLLAVVVFLRKEIQQILPAWFDGWRSLQWNHDGLLGWMIIAGTVPLGLVGLLAGDFIEENLRTAFFIAGTTISFGLLLGWADMSGQTNKTELESLTFKHALLIGLAQALALVPGTSRSGITMTALLALGYSRVAAAKFSFLLAIPAIALPGMLKTEQLVSGGQAVAWDMLFLGATVSAIVAFLTMHWFIALISSIGMRPFVIYRVVLGIVIIAMVA